MQSPSTLPPDWPEVLRARRAIVVVDVVESVRLMREHEADFIERWRRFVNLVRTQLLPSTAGRMVKSLGDGMLLEFERVPAAMNAALAIQRRIDDINVGAAPSARIALRVGGHVSEVVVDADDIYGAGVNLAARLASLAGPGEIVVSSEVRDELVAGLDAEVEDLGECFLKHIDTPVRAFRVGPVGPRPEVPAASEPAADLRAVAAVVPFDWLGDPAQSEHLALGDLIADGVIALLSGNRGLRLVSRMSTAAFRGRHADLAELEQHLGAAYVLSGSCMVQGSRLVVTFEVADVRRRSVLSAERVTGELGELLQDRSELLDRLAGALCQAVLDAEIEAARLRPPPTLQSYSLQLGGIQLMHRSTGRDFERVRDILEHLIARHPRLAVPRAWLAKWYVLRVTRGIVRDNGAEAAIALEHTRRALDADPACSIALAMQGFVQCHMLRDLDGAMTTLDSALAANPNDSLAWLFKGVVLSLWGQGEQALQAVTEAKALSPLDPLGHYYDALAAPAALSAGRYELAAELAQRSLRVNRAHSPTLRALVIALAELDRLAEAGAAVQTLLTLEPGLTVQSYLERSPAGANDTRRRYAEALRRAGVPMH